MMLNIRLNKCNMHTNRYGKNKGYPKIAPPNMFPKTTDTSDTDTRYNPQIPQRQPPVNCSLLEIASTVSTSMNTLTSTLRPLRQMLHPPSIPGAAQSLTTSSE